jgi:CRP/FNR family transcriptional regulator, cyclic AMP receptor protein
MTEPDNLENKDRLETFWPGQSIFVEGDAGRLMFVVMEGRVRLKIKGKTVEEIGPGGIFGELALVDGSPRSASAEALTACTLATISEERFENLVLQTPGFALRVMRVLALRLRNMDSLL